MTRRVISREGDVLDLVALEAYGRTAGTTEAILDTNPAIAGLGPVLPAGVELILPDLADDTVAAGTVRLWD
jgi:phage tail protein X